MSLDLLMPVEELAVAHTALLRVLLGEEEPPVGMGELTHLGHSLGCGLDLGQPVAHIIAVFRRDVSALSSRRLGDRNEPSLRIPRQADHPFRRKPTTVPTEADHGSDAKPTS